jgi:hypothetical protein
MPILSCRNQAPSGRRVSAPQRVIVKLRPEQYDELFRYVHLVGSTLSEFLRESAVNAMDPSRKAKSSTQVLAKTKTVRKAAKSTHRDRSSQLATDIERRLTFPERP